MQEFIEALAELEHLKRIEHENQERKLNPEGEIENDGFISKIEQNFRKFFDKSKFFNFDNILSFSIDTLEETQIYLEQNEFSDDSDNEFESSENAEKNLILNNSINANFLIDDIFHTQSKNNELFFLF